MAQPTQKIVWTGQKLSWLEARKFTKEKGGLPSNVLYEDFLHSADTPVEVARELCPAWTREVVVYPEKGGVFKEGMDVVDSVADALGRHWVLDAARIPHEALEMRGVSLLIEPEGVVEKSDRVVIVPGQIIILEGLGQEPVNYGIVAGFGSMPLGEVHDAEQIEHDQKVRVFRRLPGVGVRPLVRDCDDKHDDFGRLIAADFYPTMSLGVAYVEQVGTQATRCISHGQIPSIQV